MIKLSDVSARAVFYNSERDLIKLADENSCYNVVDLINLMEQHPEYDWTSINQRIDKLKQVVVKSNGYGGKLETYEYENNGIEAIDRLNSASVLLLGSPTTPDTTKFREIKCNYTVDAVKHNLKLTDQWGKNIIGNIRSIGATSIPVIIDSLKMYDEQVQRQAELVKDMDCNIFTYDKKLKEEIVEDFYSDIIMYLIYNTKEKTVWGKLSDAQKELYISSAINTTKKDYTIKNSMIDMISNYTTLEELENVASGDKKVLNRFIKK